MPRESVGVVDHLDAARPLDREVQRLLPTSDGWVLAAFGPILGLLAAVLFLGVVGVAFGLPGGSDARAGYGAVGEAVFAAVIFAVARPLARRAGGWLSAFGLASPAHGQGRTIWKWVGIQFGIRIGLGLLLVAAIPELRGRHLGNLNGVGDLHVAGALALLVGAVGIAPVAEELAFRGVMLRALMRRFRFWPSAILCSVLFGVMHAGTVDSWTAAAFTLPTLAIFGLLQCVLVRRFGDISAAIGVHATMNLIAAGLFLLTAHAST